MNTRKDHCHECYPWKYPEELRERATRMSVRGPAGTPRGLRGGDPQDRRGAGRPPRGAAHLGHRKAEVDAGARPGTTSQDTQRIRELEKEVRELRRANEILRKASAYFAQAELDRR